SIPKTCRATCRSSSAGLTEELNRHWYEKNSGQVVTEVQRQLFHPVHRWMAATLDGRGEATGPGSRPSLCCPGISRLYGYQFERQRVWCPRWNRSPYLGRAASSEGSKYPGPTSNPDRIRRGRSSV